MQEEVTQKTIALVFKSSRLTADVLKKAMKMYLEHRKAGQQATHGKMSVKKLVGQGMGASSIEVTDNNIKPFERVARKYNVDFAVKKDKTVEPPKYMVFFKGKDADVITQAFKEFVKVNEKKRGRVSVREFNTPSSSAIKSPTFFLTSPSLVLKVILRTQFLLSASWARKSSRAHDFAQVYVNGKYVGKIDRVKNEKSLELPAMPQGAQPLRRRSPRSWPARRTKTIKKEL